MKTKEHSERDLTYFQTTENNETRTKNKGDNSQEPMKNHPYHIIPKWLPCSNRQQRLLDYVAGPEQGQVKAKIRPILQRKERPSIASFLPLPTGRKPKADRTPQIVTINCCLRGTLCKWGILPPGCQERRNPEMNTSPD